MEFKDYYEIMGVGRDADQDEIKRAYRKLSRKFHPDVSKEADAESRFKDLGEAYEVLKDPEKRAAYDQLAARWRSGQDFRVPPDWNQGGFEFQGGGFTEADAGDFSEFFESLFGHGGLGAGARRRPRHEFHARGEDARAKIQIDLEDAYRGGKQTLSLKHREAGPDGRPRMKERVVDVSIPKGVSPGQHIRLAGMGGAGLGQGESGDLYLEVEFRPHRLYKVEGKDVYLTLPVAPWEAALGAELTVPTPSGLVDLRIPPNSQGGRKLRLAGRGIPARTPGDLYVVLQVVLPKADSEGAKRAYRAFAEAARFDPRAHMGI